MFFYNAPFAVARFAAAFRVKAFHYVCNMRAVESQRCDYFVQKCAWSNFFLQKLNGYSVILLHSFDGLFNGIAVDKFRFAYPLCSRCYAVENRWVYLCEFGDYFKPYLVSGVVGSKVCTVGNIPLVSPFKIFCYIIPANA